MMRSILSPKTLTSVFCSGLSGLAMLSAGCGQDPNLDLDPPGNQQDELVPPSNWTKLNTTSAPTWLSLSANSNSSSGTKNDITLVYRNKTASYACTITNTISDGGTAGCVPTQSSSETNGDYDYFFVKYADKSSETSSDGLLITSLGVVLDGNTYNLGVFSKANTTFTHAISCTGCGGIFSEYNCNSCWIDGDDHSICKEVRVTMSAYDDYYIRCID